MTIITVTTPKGRLSSEQRSLLSESLTDAVLVPEVGRSEPRARFGFQVHFNELSLDRIAIGGRLLSDSLEVPDVATIDICVMDAAWPNIVRKQMIENVLSAMADACDMEEASPTWWTTFRVIEEGSWGARGSTLSILDLLETGIFTSERIEKIREALT